MPALEQFREGLYILGLLDKFKVFKEFKELMCTGWHKLISIHYKQTTISPRCSVTRD